MATETKFCTDCKFCRVGCLNNIHGPKSILRCVHPSVAEIVLESGRVVGKDCWGLRRDYEDSICGIVARNFQPVSMWRRFWLRFKFKHSVFEVYDK